MAQGLARMGLKRGLFGPSQGPPGRPIWLSNIAHTWGHTKGFGLKSPSQKGPLEAYLDPKIGLKYAKMAYWRSVLAAHKF